MQPFVFMLNKSIPPSAVACMANDPLLCQVEPTFSPNPGAFGVANISNTKRAAIWSLLSTFQSQLSSDKMFQQRVPSSFSFCFHMLQLHAAMDTDQGHVTGLKELRPTGSDPWVASLHTRLDLRIPLSAGLDLGPVNNGLLSASN